MLNKELALIEVFLTSLINVLIERVVFGFVLFLKKNGFPKKYSTRALRTSRTMLFACLLQKNESRDVA